jgi:hypothetical protein
MIPSSLERIDSEDITSLMLRKILMRLVTEVHTRDGFQFALIEETTRERMTHYLEDALKNINFCTLAMPHAQKNLTQIISELSDVLCDPAHDFLQSPQEASSQTCGTRFKNFICCKGRSPRLRLPNPRTDDGRALQAQINEKIRLYLGAHPGLQLSLSVSLAHVEEAASETAPLLRRN